jgi:hypothetical protein
MLKQLAAIGAIGVFSSSLFAQGLNTSQTKDQWEEINFEFNSSVLSDGYPSLLRLADILNKHHDFHVKLTGNTDYVGSARYNDRLAMRRAETVRDFLVKYGAAADQISTAGDGKKDPEVDNKTKEGRFMNRRVVMTVTDGQGNVVAAGGFTEVGPTLADLLKKQEECCTQILKRLDKLDDILAAVRDLKGENDRLKGELADLQNQEKALEDKVNGIHPLTKDETTAIAEKAGQDTLQEAQNRNKKFSLLGLDIGPTVGNRPNGDVTIHGSGQFFSPFGGDGTHAVQAQGEYIRYPGDQEGQFDVGLVNRWDHLQAGMFASFKYIRLEGDTNGGSMGQGAFLLDYLFSRGRVGFYGTEGFKSTGALLLSPLGPSSYMETYARPMDQFGGTIQVGTWGDAWIQGNFGYIHSRMPGNPNRPGGEIKLVQPIAKELAFTVRAGLNPTLLTASNTGEVTVGLEFGNFMRPKDFTTFTHPVPMDVPRIRYELLTKQVGHSAPVADAGPNQIGIPAGTVTLNGSGSYSPDHDALSYSWTQVSGPSVAISGANMAIATFPAAGSTSYGFRLTVTDQVSGLFATANTTVTTQRFLVARFTATPPSISAGQSSTLSWNVPNATSVTISGGVGSNLPAAGTATVSPTQTTTYNLTATGSGGATLTASVTVTVGASKPVIVRFQAAPTSISSGASSSLSWATTGASTVSITPNVGNEPVNGSTNVSPTATTTYTLTATGADGKTTVTAAVTVTVGGGSVPTVLSFAANPPVISPGGQTSLCWNVSNATTVSIAPGIGTVQPVACATVSPTANTTYILTASNGVGPIQATVTVSVGPVQILTFSASPASSPASGAPVVLSWTTQNATSVIITGTGAPGGSLGANGSVTVNPTSNSDYTLTAYGPGGPVSSVIHVFVR